MSVFGQALASTLAIACQSTLFIDKKAVTHKERTVAHGRESGIVGDDDNGLSVVRPQVEEKLVDFGFGVGVEVAGRLVCKEYGGIVDKGPCYCNSLLFTTGEFRWFVFEPMGKTHFVQKTGGLRPGFFLGTSCDKGRNHHVLKGAELRQKMMELEYEADASVPERGEFPAAEMKHIGSVDEKTSGVRG